MSSHTHHTRTPATDRWSSEVLPRLPADLEQQAFKLGALRRKRAFASADLLLRGLLAYALQASSLNHLGAWGVLTDVADLSAPAWLKRLLAAAPWLSWVLSKLLGGTPTTWLARYGRWRAKVIDITTFGRHGGTGDDWRVQVSYDLLSGQFSQLVITDRSKAEDLGGMQLQAGDIAIVDAGYGRRRHIAKAVEQQADIVVRVYLPTCPLHDGQGRALELVSHLERRGARTLERSAFVQHDGKQIAVRVIAVPLPAHQAAAARRRLHKTARRKGRTASPTGLLLAGWLVLVTTLPAEAWQTADVVQLYRARWQIEVVFKRFKQLLALQKVRCKNEKSARALLTLSLIGWALSYHQVARLRSALEAAARPAPATLPGQWPEQQAVVSSWRVQQVSLDTLRQQVWGEWSQARVQECLPRLQRHLVTHPRRDGRVHQESEVRARLSGQRFTRPRPLADAE